MKGDGFSQNGGVLDCGRREESRDDLAGVPSHEEVPVDFELHATESTISEKLVNRSK